LGVSGSVRTVVGSVLSPGEKPSGVAGAGAVATGAETVRGGRGGLLTAVASNAGRTIRPDRSRRFIAALDRGLSSPFASEARGDEHRSAGPALAPVAYPVSATTGASDHRARPARTSDGSAPRVPRRRRAGRSARRRRARPLTRHVFVHRRSEEKAEALCPKRGGSGKMSIRKNRHQREPAASA